MVHKFPIIGTKMSTYINMVYIMVKIGPKHVTYFGHKIPTRIITLYHKTSNANKTNNIYFLYNELITFVEYIANITYITYIMHITFVTNNKFIKHIIINKHITYITHNTNKTILSIIILINVSKFYGQTL